MLRSALLSLSRQPWLRQWVETSPLTQSMTRRFVAGSSLDDVLRVAERLQRDGISITLDYLGENVTSVAEAHESLNHYREALDRIAARKLPASVSIKLTQFGLDLSPEVCCRNVLELVQRAHAVGTRVEIDMESSAYTDRTLRIVHDMHSQGGSVRAVIQSYLYRSEADVCALSAAKIPVRLCKGAYQESASVAYPAKRDVDANYVKLMHQLLRDGTYPAIASHDETIIMEAVRFVQEQSIGASKFEFQMLYGIRRDLQAELVRRGYQVRLYVPYGTAWYPYFMRRLAERPANLLFLARNLVRQ